MPEKVLRWPVGFTDPFKPNGRFEVIHWRYFDKSNIYGDVDSEPVTKISGADRKDLDEIYMTSLSALKKEMKDIKDSDIMLRAGFKRHDPKRGLYLRLSFSGIMERKFSIFISSRTKVNTIILAESNYSLEAVVKLLEYVA